jgi:glycosyltransferase involved in cell wall biosynthesis
MKFTIILPVFNAESYLKRCIDSLLNQNYDNYEIILINDGSTDKSVEIIHSYLVKTNKIKFFQKKNGGIGSAYNIAFQNIEGEYVLFIDNDDELAPFALDKLNSLLSINNIDIIQFGIIFHEESKNYKKKSKVISLELYKNSNIIKYHYKKFKDPILSTRVYKKELFDNIILLNQSVCIDELIFPQILYKTESIKFIKEYLYTAHVRRDSVSRSKLTKQKIIETSNVFILLIKIYITKNHLFVKHIFDKYYLYLIYYLKLNINNIKSDELSEILSNEFFNMPKPKKPFKDIIIFVNSIRINTLIKNNYNKLYNRLTYKILTAFYELYKIF